MSNEDNPGLSRRKLLSSALAIGAASTGIGAGAGTYAWFQDREQSTGNTIQSGTLDLEATENTSITQTITGDLNDNAPGTNLSKEIKVDLNNAGSLEANHLEIDFLVEADEDNNGVFSDGTTPGPESDPQQTPNSEVENGGDGMSKYIRVERLAYTEPNSTLATEFVTAGKAVTESGVYDVNENTWIDLDDLAKLSSDKTNPRGENPFDNLKPPIPNGSDASFELVLSGIAEAVGDPFQGDIVTLDVTFSLHQDSTRDFTS